MTTLLRPDNKQPAAYVTSRNGHICLRTDCLSPSVMWFSDAAMNKLNPVHTCEPPPKVECMALAIWRPTIEVPITELGFYKEGSKQKAIPGLQLHESNVRIVLTLPEAA